MGGEHEHKSQTVTLRGLTVVYELHGAPSSLPAIVLTPGGGGGRGGFRWLAHSLAKKTGRCCLVWDRPNTGASSLTLGEEPTQPEFDLQADVLHLLLAHLGLSPVILLGKSNGARLSLVFAAKHPASCCALVLLNVTAGSKAAKQLSADRYYKLLDACACGGMEEVARTAHYAKLFEKNAANRAVLLSWSPARFMLTMRLWGEALSKAGDAEAFPVTGLSRRLLARVAQPALCVYIKPAGEDDGMHTEAALRGLHAALPGASLPPVVADEKGYANAIAQFVQAAAPAGGPAPPAEAGPFALPGAYEQLPSGAELEALRVYYGEAADRRAEEARRERASWCHFGGYLDGLWVWKRHR